MRTPLASTLVLLGMTIAPSPGAFAWPDAPPTAPATAPATIRSVGPATATDANAALQEAAAANKHLFVFVREVDESNSREARRVMDSALAKLARTPGEGVLWIAIERRNPAERAFVKTNDLRSSPVPVVLVFAPNGAIEGGFFGPRLTEELLVDAVASPATQRCLRALQDRKFVVLCAQNASTRSNEAAMNGVTELRREERFAKMTEVVMVDPRDPVETKLLAQFALEPSAEEATTVLLGPPGTVLATFTGTTDKLKFAAAIEKSLASCGPGCGPKGCPPKK